MSYFDRLQAKGYIAGRPRLGDPQLSLPVARAGRVHAELGAVRHRDFVMASGEMDEAEFTNFLTRSCLLLTRHSVDGAIHFLCMDWKTSTGSPVTDRS